MNLYAYVGNGVVTRANRSGMGVGDIRKSCKGLNPNSYLTCLGAERCEQCCNALAANLPGYIGTIVGAGVPGPISIPDSRVFSCQIDCETRCRRFPSGSLAIRNFTECLLKGTAYDYLIGIVLDRLIKVL